MELTKTLKDQVWSNGQIITGHPSSIWRKDQCNAWMKYNDYGNRDSQFGWEIDHISLGGKTVASNLRPLQWQNNIAKNNEQLKCATTAKPFEGIHSNT